MLRACSLLVGLFLLLVPRGALAEEMPPPTVAELAKAARPSVVVIQTAGRAAGEQELEHRNLALVGGEEERRRSIAVLRVHGNSGVEERLRFLEIAAPGGLAEILLPIEREHRQQKDDEDHDSPKQ